MSADNHQYLYVFQTKEIVERERFKKKIDDNLSAMRGTDSGRTREEVERARFHLFLRREFV